MIISMTGYGNARREAEGQMVLVECKSLNSRGLEITTRFPRSLVEREMELRALVTRQLQRGKISFTIEMSTAPTEAATAVPIGRFLDAERLRAAYQELTTAAAELGASLTDPLALALTLPGVVRRGDAAEADTPVMDSTALWELVQPLALEALTRLEEHRRAEGETLATELRGYAARIRQLLAEVMMHDPSRVAQVRARLEMHLAELSQPELLDKNRLEQEMLYYIEKLDIEEEKVRLTSHLDYYEQLLTDPEPAGKKLGFLAQEIGREINTIGSKANDATIQHLVVSMKEELEKIKEQINNVL